MRCPICTKLFLHPIRSELAHAPFCSERCKLIDLGRWLDGKYQIPVREGDRDNASVHFDVDDDAASR